MSAAFTLENGAAQLRATFGDVKLYRYTDALEVTEVEPLIAYVQSMKCGAELSAAALERVRAHFTSVLQQRGAIHISKDSGVFLARDVERATASCASLDPTG